MREIERREMSERQREKEKEKETKTKTDRQRRVMSEREKRCNILW